MPYVLSVFFFLELYIFLNIQTYPYFVHKFSRPQIILITTNNYDRWCKIIRESNKHIALFSSNNVETGIT